MYRVILLIIGILYKNLKKSPNEYKEMCKKQKSCIKYKLSTRNRLKIILV